MLYGSPCKFLGICSGYDSPESGKWTIKGVLLPYSTDYLTWT
jgi:hypothetical protein